jgi:menaquinone-9 beta-reductase
MLPQESVYDLIVIGGGPAGTSAAITAARGGARVLLLERGCFPRHKVCGEFVSAESLDLLAALLNSQYAALLHDAIRIPRARLYLNGRVLETSVDPPAASIARLDLDAALWQSAKSAGVEARPEITVHSIFQSSPGTGPFRILTGGEEFEACALVNSSGRWSNVIGAPTKSAGTRKKWLGIKAHFVESSVESSADASVDLYFFEGGYCGVQPVGLRGSDSPPRVNACAMVRADVARTLPEVFAQHPALFQRSGGWQLFSEAITTSPLIFSDPKPEQNGILMAGDAAGFVDPFVGDGISLALRSGSLAGQCLIPFFAGESSLQEASRNYRQTYAKRLAPVFQASSKIRRMLILPRAVRKPLLFLLENTPGITRYVVRKTR